MNENYIIAMWATIKKIFTWYFHGLPQICVWHTENPPDISMAVFLFTTWQCVVGLYGLLIYVCNISMDVRNENI